VLSYYDNLVTSTIYVLVCFG